MLGFWGRLIGITLVLLVVGGLLLQRLLPSFIDLPGLKTKIETSIYQSTGIRAQIKTLSIRPTLLGGISIIFDNNILFDPKDVKVVRAGQVTVNVRYWPLLFGKTSISQIGFENIEVYIGERSILFRLKRPKTPSKDVVLEDSRILFNNYHIIVDRYFDNRNKYFLDGKTLVISHVNSNRALEMHGQGDFFFGVFTPNQPLASFVLRADAKQDILKKPKFNWRDLQRIHLQLTGLQLPTFARIARTFGIPVTATGQVQELFLSLQGQGVTKIFTIAGQMPKATDLQWEQHRFHFEPGSLLFRTDLNMDAQERLVALNHIVLKLWNRQFQTLGSGNVQLRIPVAKSLMDIKLSTSKLPVAALGLYPLLTPEYRDLLHRIQGYFATQLHVTGPLQKLDAVGQIRFRSITLPSRRPTAPLLEKFGADLNLQSLHRWMIRTLGGKVANSPMHGQLQLDLAAQTLAGQLDASNINLALAQELLQAILPYSASRWAFPIQGRGDAHFRIAGSLKQPDLTGTVSLNGTQVYVPQQKTPFVQGLQAFLQLDRQTVSVVNAQAVLGNALVRAFGTLNRQNGQLHMNLISNALDLSAVQHIAEMFRPALKGQTKMAGSATLDLLATGTLTRPLLDGAITLHDAAFSYLPKSLTVSQIQGPIRFHQQTLESPGIRAKVNTLPVQVSGHSDTTFKTYQARLEGKNLSVTRIRDTLLALSPGSAALLKSLNVTAGNADLNVLVTSATPKKLGGTMSLHSVAFQPDTLKTPVRIESLTYNLESGDLRSPSGNGLIIGPFQFTVSGKAAASDYRVQLKSQTLPVAALRENRAILQKLAAVPLPTFFNTAGSVQITLRLTPAQKDLLAHFTHAGASFAELKYPVYDVNGDLTVHLDKKLHASADNLSFRYGNSPMNLSLQMNSLKDLYLETSGTLSPLLLNEILRPTYASTITYAAIPFEVNLTGKIGQLFGAGLGNDLSMFLNVNVTSLFGQHNAPTTPPESGAPDPSLAQATLSSVLHLERNHLQVEQTRFRTGEQSSLLLSGQADEIFRPDKRTIAMSLQTEPVLNLKGIAQQWSPEDADGLSGSIETALTLLSAPGTFSAVGDVLLNQLHLPSYQVENLNGKIHFDGRQATINIPSFKTPGVDVGFSAHIDDLLRYPLPISDFNVAGKEFIVMLYSDWINKVVVGKIRQGLWERFFKSTASSGPGLPFEIKNGNLQVDEGIINNLIVKHYTSNIKVYPNTYFELGNIHGESAGGSGSGYFSMNPRDNNFMTIHLNIKNMKANAVSRIFLNVTNQIFGDLSGTLDYTTEGTTNEDILSHTNGVARLKIDNGRLPSITKIENLLIAANTISGGIANLNLNSLFRVAAPFHTDYFATLTGMFKMVDGFAYTDNMLIDGENLDFKMQGWIRMLDGYANMKLHGQLDQEIAGVLGPLGNLSIGRFIGMIPPLRALINHIPGLGFVPGFGGPREKGLAFDADILGPLVDPGSVQHFKWAH